MALKYTGGGFGGFMVGVPARDLTDAEVEMYGGAQKLLATGLYERADAAPEPGVPSAPAVGAIDLRDGVDDAEATLAGRTLRTKQMQQKKEA